MQSYTLILSRGTHVVSPLAADAILQALAERAPLVSVDLDVLCDGFVRRGVQLSTAHIIALVPNESASCGGDDDASFVANLSALRRAR